MNRSLLDQAILRTVCYFDLFDYPLTPTEIWTWLYKPELPLEKRTIDIVTAAAERMTQEGPLERTEAFYHLRGRSALVPERKQRNIRMDKQMRKVVRLVSWLRLIPSIRMIAISSSLSIGNVKETSDIDLFLIARKGEIWRARLFAAGSLKLLRQRPDRRITRDRFCLSFYITDDALDISSGQFGPEDILYHVYFQSILPVYDPDNWYGRFLEANHWMEPIMPNGYRTQVCSVAVGRPAWVSFLNRVFDFFSAPFFSGPLRDWPARLQMGILPESLKSIANVDTRVVISDTMLKFYDKDTRREVSKRWQEKVTEYASRDSQ